MEVVRKVREGLSPQYEFDERELALLALAERQAADLDKLEAAIEANGVQEPGAWRVNGAVAEARQARVALARILGQLDLPQVGTARSEHARRAARARWAA